MLSIEPHDARPRDRRRSIYDSLMADGTNHGASLGGRVEESPKRRARRAAARRREEKRWAAKSGPVTVRFVDPATLKRDSAADDGDQADAAGHSS